MIDEERQLKRVLVLTILCVIITLFIVIAVILGTIKDIEKRNNTDYLINNHVICTEKIYDRYQDNYRFAGCEDGEIYITNNFKEIDKNE